MVFFFLFKLIQKEKPMEEKRAEWTNHISFILATVGSAVGLGNVWRFPYIMGKYGGAVFLFTYLFLIAFICIIPLCVELTLGKISRKDTVTTFNMINPKFKGFGWLCVLTVVLISCFYFVVGGWILQYLWLFLTNNIPENFSQYFPLFASGTTIPVILTILFLVMCAIFPFRGVNKGIEKANNIMMPSLAVMLILLAIYSLSLPGAKEGLEFMFKPDFSKFSSSMVLTALGQALFTLSIGMGAILTYGSYMKQDTKILKSSYTLIGFDTTVSLLSGIMIFPIVFSFNVEPTAGPTLIFISLPEMFSKLPFPAVLGSLFFILILFAAITSGISMLETAIASMIENFKISRKKATVLLSLFISVVSIPSVFSFGIMKDFQIFGKTFFDFLDFITSNILLPLNTALICLIAGWFVKSIKKEAFGENILGNIFYFLLKFVIPLIFIGVLITGLIQV